MLTEYPKSEGLNPQESQFIQQYLQFLDYIKMGFSIPNAVEKAKMEVEQWQQFEYLVPYWSVNDK